MKEKGRKGKGEGKGEKERKREMQPAGFEEGGRDQGIQEAYRM